MAVPPDRYLIVAIVAQALVIAGTYTISHVPRDTDNPTMTYPQKNPKPTTHPTIPLLAMAPTLEIEPGSLRRKKKEIGGCSAEMPGFRSVGGAVL